jgi:nitrogen fixation protein NifZ
MSGESGGALREELALATASVRRRVAHVPLSPCRKGFASGDRVRAVVKVANDGTYPRKDIGEGVVQIGDLGVVRDRWSFLGEIFYTVEFPTRAAKVIMRGHEMARLYG